MSEPKKPMESESFIPKLSIIEKFDETVQFVGW